MPSRNLSATLSNLVSTTGSGNIVLSNNATLISPNLGTPASGNLVNCILQTASNTVLGGVIVDGTSITIAANGVISGASTYTLPTANTTTLGGVKVDGTTITANNGVISSIMARTIKTISGTYTVLPSDNGKIILCIGSTYVVYLSAAATLGSGFSCYIYAANTSSIIISPSNSEKLDNRTNGSYYMYGEGAGAEVVCDGTGFWLGARKLPMGMAFGAYSSGYSAATASGAAAFAYGGQASAAGNRSVAFGEVSNASAQGAYTFGDSSTASGQYSYALGYKASSLGQYSVAIGYLASANVSYSTAIGQNSSGGQASANAYGAIALSGSFAGGIDSFSVAVANNSNSYGATGNNSIAIGRLTKASGANSVAIGSSSTGVGAVAAGSGAISLGASYSSGTDSFAAAIVDNTSSYGATVARSIAIGYLAKASGGVNNIAMGYGSISSNNDSIAIGNNSTATGDSACSVGKSAIASGTCSWATHYGTASALASVTFGGLSAQIGKYTYANGYNFSNGIAQSGKIVLYAATTTTTAVVLTSDGAAASTTNQLIVASGQAMTFFGTLIAKQSASANMASYMIKGAIVNNGGTVSISSISVETIIDTIVLDVQPTFTADNTNKGLAVTSGYKAATNIRWVCNLDSVEVTYA